MTEQIVFLDDDGLAPSTRLKRPDFEHKWLQYPYTHPDQVLEHLQDATIALTCSVPLRAEHLRQLPKLKMISLALTGRDIVDVDYCDAHGIEVSSVPGYAANTVAEHSLAMILELFRRPAAFTRLMRQVHAGQAPHQNIYFNHRVRDIRDKRLAIIGSGPIALRLAHLARALGMQVLFEDRGGKRRGSDCRPLGELLESCDVLSINCPLTPETYNLIDAEHLALMKPDAVVVNTGRGGVINEAALIAALENGQLGGVALDVVEHEPLHPSNPLFTLIERDDFLLNPHIAWSSEDAMQQLMDGAVDNISDFVNRSSVNRRVCNARL
ncbi:NAD(P)-dependent oxidoreductase [Pseudomonas sp. 148P]|uniref:NAD(P)-dependent oxidoreductase n=1 Tax=Pseudomonas ulcerans TaxID=3115852 RepID=A0ABU7HRU8_9PSED|nr:MULTISPECIES: NAD(P)-dependent oxidoreductase [unclassified Pseudomonas]MEE1922108.1 NAD(P)-dependent oxidoreductase [Pseudomonas sp. 147P]MEE1934232.1 NAD(P)-dependent oxidoreductase [Pseudomonas sp. 148P]